MLWAFSRHARARAQQQQQQQANGRTPDGHSMDRIGVFTTARSRPAMHSARQCTALAHEMCSQRLLCTLRTPMLHLIPIPSKNDRPRSRQQSAAVCL